MTAASTRRPLTPTAEAKRAIAEMTKHRIGLETAQRRRDRAIHAMHAEGKNPPSIARELELSISLVRLVLKVPPPPD